MSPLTKRERAALIGGVWLLTVALPSSLSAPSAQAASMLPVVRDAAACLHTKVTALIASRPSPWGEVPCGNEGR